MEQERGIRVIGLDLDGTVFDDDKAISERTVRAITAAAARGVAVLPATGRFLTGLSRAFLEVPGVQYALTSNGALVTELSTGRQLVRRLIPHERALAVVDVLSRFPCLPNAFIGGEGYTSLSNLAGVSEYYQSAAMSDYVRAFHHPDCTIREIVEAHEGQVEKLNAVFRSAEVRSEAIEALKEVPCEVSSSFHMNIEINDEGVDKGEGLLALAAALGWGPENVMACGDSSNDIAMLRKAGLGVAMGNASEAVKEAADAVTLSNNEDGVAVAIERYVLR